MIEGRIIVSLANSWDYDPTSKHQIMRIFSRRNEIVWVDYHGTRRPRAGKADVAAAWSVMKGVVGGIQRVGPSMVRVTPLVIPGAAGTAARSVHRRLLVAQIRRAIRSVGGAGNRAVQVWSFAPDVPYLVGQFGEECFLYYCVDEYSQFKGFDARRISAAENELIDRADVVVTTSEPLLEAKRLRRSDVILMRHGVEYKHFAGAWQESQARPEDLAEVRGPVFGFFGLIHHWVDLALIAQVARIRPRYTFVLIGEAKVDVSELRELPNVLLPGRRAYGRLPAYCAAFDAGLLPFACTAMTRHINPIKMREYLAAGLPIVSTPLPEAELYPGAIRIAATAGEFARACDEVLSDDAAGRRKDISRLVESESWLSKVECLSDVIMERMGLQSHAVSLPRSKLAIPAAAPVGVLDADG